MLSYPTAYDRELQKATVCHVMDQIHSGFSPQWMLTYHYGNPYERGWRVIENAKRWGYRIPTNRMLWSNVGFDQSLLARRNDPIRISRDAQHIRNLLIQHGWGINGDLRKHDPSTTPMLFVHERGREQIQYHTHLLISALPDSLNNPQAIHKLWKEAILPKARCLSRTNSLHVEPVSNVRGMMRYLSKEVRANDINVDYIASCLVNPDLPVPGPTIRPTPQALQYGQTPEQNPHTLLNPLSETDDSEITAQLCSSSMPQSLTIELACPESVACS
jgi:hypothetical protein